MTGFDFRLDVFSYLETWDTNGARRLPVYLLRHIRSSKIVLRSVLFKDHLLVRELIQFSLMVIYLKEQD